MKLLRRASPLLIVFFGSIGATTAQLLVVKILEDNVHNEILSYIVVFGAHFLGLAIAARAPKRRALYDYQAKLGFLTPLFIIFCLWAPALSIMLTLPGASGPPPMALASTLIVIPLALVSSTILGYLHGVEMPLVHKLFQSSLGSALAVSYFGALLAFMAVPIFILPNAGIYKITAALIAVYAVNIGLARLLLRGRAGVRFALSIIMAVAGVGSLAALESVDHMRKSLIYASGLERWPEEPFAESESALRFLAANISVATWRTPFQTIDWVTYKGLGNESFRLYLNGEFQFDSTAEAAYHAGFFWPTGRSLGPRVLLIGAGDGLLAREVLARHPEATEITIVEIDPQVLTLARTLSPLVQMNGASLLNPLVRSQTEDAFAFAANCRARYDAVLIDLPHPSSFALARVYSKEFYEHLYTCLVAESGFLIMDAPIEGKAGGILKATLQAAGFPQVILYGEGNTYIYAGRTLDQEIPLRLRALGARIATPEPGANPNTLTHPLFPFLN